MDMEIIGRHSLLFDDDAMSAFVNSVDALVDWHSLQIDRYDVRHLLSAPPPPRRRNRSCEPRTSDDPSIDFLIDQERYLDLPLETNQPDLKEEEEEKPSNSGGYHAIAFSYGNTDDSADQKNTDIEMEAKGYLPPFFVPGDIVLPPTEKVHQIIARTAIFVSKHGGQSEIILRVKQGDNPTFGFLMPDHHLHTYFRYLVEHPELLHPEIDEKSQDGRKMAGTEYNNSGNIGGALSLLGSVYGSGEDEDTDDAVNASLSHDAKNMESVETAATDESGKSILSKKDKVPALKKNASIIGSKRKSVKGRKKEDNSGAKEEKLRNHGIGATSKPIVEPPPELKRMVDKLVEFITRNGRQFEATLLEQDSKLERFPFLLSSNQYHPYYLKALEAAQESKVNGKSFYPGQEDLGGRGISRKGSLPKENGISHTTSELCDVPFESDRKEKFKMVIGKSKKDAQEEAEKESQACGFTVDAAAAAAILQAATKGIKSSGLRYITSTASNSHINAVRNEDGQPANSGNLQPLLPYSTGEKSEQSGSYNPSASHEIAGGDDYSNSNLTDEQMLKSKRLKRAKMFVAMLKSGALPSKIGASRGSSAEPVEHGVWKSVAEGRYASQEREGSAPAVVVYKSAVDCNFSERQSDQQSKRKYRSESIGRKDDEEDSDREGHLIRKRRISRRPEDDENENAVEKEHRYNQEKGRHQSHSTKDNKTEGESSEENKYHKDNKSLRSSHHSQGDDNESEGMCNEDREAKDSGHHPERKYRSRSQRGDKEVGNAVGKDRKHRRSKRGSNSSSEESDNGEESDGQDAEHKHYKSKHISRRSHRDDNVREGAYKEERDKEHKRSHGSRSRRHGGKNAVEKEDKKYRRKHLSHLSYEENGGSSGDEKENHCSKSSHSKHKIDGDEDIYKEEKDRKRSRKSYHSSSESPSRHSSERRKKHRSSRTSHHSKDKHKLRHRKDRESHHRHKHDGSSDDEHQHRASSCHPEKESLDLEEGEISSKDESKGIVTGDGQREASVDVVSSEQRATSLPSETTEVPADLRAKIRAMLMATRS
ncbi:protein suppressor of white apricot isoform X1 [Salvia divinorum]|uniref:Protein suppressor of white apricot isoform X1 n=1 Tax=Salvia divinorum TaxID=28513 RepID=A0ABD1I3H7_SALDI